MTRPTEVGTTEANIRNGLLLALLASFMFSLKPIIIKEAYSLGASSESLMVLRMWFALPFYLVMLFIQRHQLIKNRRYIPAVVAVGFIGYFLSSYLDLLALESISAQAERIILYAYPSLVILIKSIYDKKMPSKRMIFALSIVYAGIILLLPGELNLTGSPIGIFLMLTCALTFAMYVLLSKPMIARMGVGVFTSTAMVASCLFTQIHFVSIELNEISSLPQSVFILALALAFFSTVIPSYAMSAAISMIGSERAAITGTTGPVFTVILAAVILGESISVYHIAGLSLVVIGVLLLSKK
ncbi:MAG: drug/metabolite transporter (DMT)-like permease [Psychrobacter glaciei]|jgi:drug/metabolite transporter (DMT)-like permease